MCWVLWFVGYQSRRRTALPDYLAQGGEGFAGDVFLDSLCLRSWQTRLRNPRFLHCSCQPRGKCRCRTAWCFFRDASQRLTFRTEPQHQQSPQPFLAARCRNPIQPTEEDRLQRDAGIKLHHHAISGVCLSHGKVTPSAADSRPNCAEELSTRQRKPDTLAVVVFAVCRFRARCWRCGTQADVPGIA